LSWWKSPGIPAFVSYSFAAFLQVVGKGIDTYILRVNVDMARRYWTIYRYEVPSFPGQLPDKTATQKLAAERIEAAESNPDLESFQTPLLYKKASIVVSWSRYMAVSVLYGPPSPRMVHAYKEAVEKMQREEDERSIQRSRNRAQSSDSLSTSSGHYPKASSPVKSFTSSVRSLPSATSLASQDEGNLESAHSTEADESVDSSGAPVSQAAACILEETSEEASPSEVLFPENPPPLLSEQKKEPLRKTIRTWIRQKSKDIREQVFDKGRQKTLVDPLEGIMHLEKPLLLCQEIYNRIIGNHQTSLVTKEQVLDLLREDNAQHAAEHPEEPDDAYSPIMTADDDDDDTEMPTSGTTFLGDLPVMLDETEEFADEYPGFGKPESKDEAGDASSSPQPEEANEGEALPKYPGNGVSEQKESELEDEPEPQDATDGTEEEEVIVTPEVDQPLVGYWLWENTLRTHKMKMYVAKGTDLTLHVALAIITNQVRYERNAIAMTI
jgi:hypothetical protein